MADMSSIDRHHSRPLRLDRKAVGQPLKNAVSALMCELEGLETGRKRARRQKDRQRLMGTLETFVADLYLAHCDDPTLCLGYSRNQNDYLALPRYRTHPVSHTSATTVADFLIAEGYAEHLPGYYRRTSNIEDSWTFGGVRSRLRATSRLVELVVEDYEVSPSDISIAPNAELIRLKNPEGKLIDYHETTETRAMRANLIKINALLADTSIEAPKVSAGENPDQTSKTIYRVFNEGRFDRGGRFYGGWWINAKKRQRRQITLNGQQTVELDFSAHHLRLCYHLSSLEAPERDDLYALEGMEGLREAVKWAVTVILNLGAGKRMPRPPETIKELLTGIITVTALRKKIEHRYAEIGSWFGAGRGTELQHVDGVIANSILNQLTEQGIPCLPIHDSFIIENRHKALLFYTMQEAYASVIYQKTGHCRHPVIKG